MWGHHFPSLSQVKPLFYNGFAVYLARGGHQMGHQSPHYLKLKGKTYYFSRRVPKELQKHSECSRFEVCLRTSVKSVAFKQAMLLAQELDDQWSILRTRERNDRIVRTIQCFIVFRHSILNVLATIYLNLRTIHISR